MKSKGFTLLELVISIAIFSIVSTAILTFYKTTQKNYELSNTRISLDNNFNELKRELNDNLKKSLNIACSNDELNRLTEGYKGLKYDYCLSKGYNPFLSVDTINGVNYLYAYDSKTESIKKIYSGSGYNQSSNYSKEKVYVCKYNKLDSSTLGYEWLRIEKNNEVEYESKKNQLKHDIDLSGLTIAYDDGKETNRGTVLYDSFSVIGVYKIEENQNNLYALIRSKGKVDSKNIKPLFLIPIKEQEVEKSTDIHEQLVCDSISNEKDAITIIKDVSDNKKYYTIHLKLMKNDISKEYEFRVASINVGGEVR